MLLDGRAVPPGLVEIDALPRVVTALASPVMTPDASVVTKGWELASHSHRKAELLFTVRGIINCEIEAAIWIVPPQCAVWIPGGTPHVVRGSGITECYCVFVEPDAAPDLPKSCCTVSVTPLLHELVQRAAAFPRLYATDGPEGRLIATLLDELLAARIESLHLPFPRDARLRKLAERLLADPADKSSLPHWASRIGMSERSLTRLLFREIGMSLGQWRRQLHVILSLQRLAGGASVQTVAFDLGYENSSSFVTMFRKLVGKPPGRYMSDRGGTLSNRAVAHCK
jgi:AraC-like DNA-binding protein/mannose-6-phosphate isomerase-like protein (cupin superfamily)